MAIVKGQDNENNLRKKISQFNRAEKLEMFEIV